MSLAISKEVKVVRPVLAPILVLEIQTSRFEFAKAILKFQAYCFDGQLTDGATFVMISIHLTNISVSFA